MKFLLIVVSLSCLVYYLNMKFPTLDFRDNPWQILYGMLVIVFVSWILAGGKIGKNLKYLFIWTGMFLILITGYSYRHELDHVRQRVVAEILPASGLQQSPGSVSFPVSSDGHYHIIAKVNGIPITFLADTGASNIVLSPADARKIGMNPATLTFDRVYQTANGEVRGSSFRIADLQIGKMHMENVAASVNEVHMANSLLGMSFFDRLAGYDVKRDILTLHWR